MKDESNNQDHVQNQHESNTHEDQGMKGPQIMISQKQPMPTGPEFIQGV